MKTIAIVGCGGLGGFVIEELARENIGKLILIDGDTFSTSNLNRQLESKHSTIGKYKAEIYANRVKEISDCDVKYHNEFLTEKNLNLLDNCDLVIDCLDNIKSRLLLAKTCKEKNLTIIHGAIEGEEGQVAICLPKDSIIENLFNGKKDINHETNSYSVATVASIQAAVASKYLSGNANNLLNKLILIDLETMIIRTLDL